MGGKDLLATTGDYLRVWNVTDDGSGRGTLTPKKEGLLNNVRETNRTSNKQTVGTSESLTYHAFHSRVSTYQTIE